MSRARAQCCTRNSVAIGVRNVFIYFVVCRSHVHSVCEHDYTIINFRPVARAEKNDDRIEASVNFMANPHDCSPKCRSHSFEFNAGVKKKMPLALI